MSIIWIKQEVIISAILIFLLLHTQHVIAQNADVTRLDPALDRIIASDARVEKVAGGFKFTEGPVWFNDGQFLVFSDIPENKIYRWDALTGKVSVYLDKSGFTGDDPTGIGREVNEGGGIFYNLGSNGITKDTEGRIVFNAMGDRAIVRLEKDGQRIVLATQYQGKRLNSGNDLVYHSSGRLYFTDPPSGLRGGDEDPDKQLPYNGVFMLKDGELQLLSSDIHHPNGLAFSVDEKFLFVNDNRARQINRFSVAEDGTLSDQQVFVDMVNEPPTGNPDGMKVDSEGNMYAAGPGGVWVISPEGRHLGTIHFPERASNMTFGGEDAKTLYVTARTGIYRIGVKIPGVRP